jgi:hypothetical protein
MGWQIRLTVELVKVASGPSASAMAASTSPTLKPRTPRWGTRTSGAPVRLTPLLSSREVNGVGGPRNRRRSSTTSPGGGLDRQGW